MLSSGASTAYSIGEKTSKFVGCAPFLEHAIVSFEKLGERGQLGNFGNRWGSRGKSSNMMFILLLEGLVGHGQSCKTVTIGGSATPL